MGVMGVTAEGFDAFVSYGHGDAGWVRSLAENLERLGLRVFLDAWELVAGDLVAVKLQEGLARAGAVVFVVSPHSVGRGWGDGGVGAGGAGGGGGGGGGGAGPCPGAGGRAPLGG